MPYYEVHHSYPLQPKQKASLARAITHLHSSTFTTPSLFVNVTFAPHDASALNYFVAGKPRETSSNRILAMVRTSEKRTKEAFDKLAGEVESAWYDAVKGEVIEDENSKDRGKRTGEVGEGDREKEAKKLLFVVFHPMIAARENGVVIPGAGAEGTWLKDNMEYFKEQAEVQGDEDFADMLKEIEEREDLRKLVEEGGGWFGGSK